MASQNLRPKCNVIKVRQADCAHCGVTCEFIWPRQKYCPTCSGMSAREELPHQVRRRLDRAKAHMDGRRRRDGIPTFKGHVIECARCGVSFPRNGAAQKYCPDCAGPALQDAQRRADVAKRRRKGRVLVGDVTACKQCGGAFVKEGVHQVYCTPTCKADWWAQNPQWVINRRMSAGINGSLRGRKGGKSWQSLVPYSLADLMTHLERQFLPGMGWANRKDWDLDHIVPLSSFTFTSPDDPEFRAAWALTNLRPLWAKDNIRKSAKRTHLI